MAQHVYREYKMPKMMTLIKTTFNQGEAKELCKAISVVCKDFPHAHEEATIVRDFREQLMEHVIK